MASPHDALTRNRRFYKAAAAAQVPGGFAVQLDGRVPRTPGGARLVLPTLALAELVAGEWEAQLEYILPDAMGATRLANTAIDRVAILRDETAGEVAAYAGSDLLCYFAEHPEALVDEEVRRWGPVLDWAADDLGVSLHRVSGIVHRVQDPAALAQVRRLALALDDFALTGLVHMAGLFGSALLALAVARDRLSAEEAYELSRLDEAFQARLWGEDEEAVARTERLRAEAAMMGRWTAALGRTRGGEMSVP